MNEYETLLQTHLNAAQAEPNPNLRNRILESAASETPVASPVRVNKGMKVLLLAALLAVVLATTAFAYSDVIRQFVFGDSRMEQVPDMGSEDGGRIVAVGGVIDADEVYWAELLAGSGNRYFDSVEEARETVPFALKNITRLPESGGEWILDHVSSGLNKDGVCGNNADINYKLDYSYTDEAG